MDNKKKIPIEQIGYEIEIIINQGLYDKQLITEDMYKKANEKLLKLIEMKKDLNLKTNNTS